MPPVPGISDPAGAAVSISGNPDMPVVPGALTLGTDVGADPEALDGVKFIAVISISGMLTGTSLETAVIDISCVPPFILEMEREGLAAPVDSPAISMDRRSSVRSIRSRLR